jgi:hypothetical protein
MRPILVVLSFLVLLCAPAHADEVRLKNGAVIQGRIVREDPESIVVDLGRGRMIIARRDIAAIRRTSNGDFPDAPSSPDREGPDSTKERSRRTGGPPTQDAIRQGGGVPRSPAQPVPRKRREKPVAVGPGPKVVPVERTPPARPRSSGGDPPPEGANPSRSSPPRGGTASAPSATKPAQRRATAKPDW